MILVPRTEVFLFNWGDASWNEVRSNESRCEVCAGIEVHSTKSRREAPGIDVGSTEAFTLNRGDAQTWLGLLVVK